MNKEGKLWAIISLIIVIILILGMIYYFFLYKPTPSISKETSNPLNNLTLEQAKIAFNESFVLYLLNEMGANELHNPPLSSETPKIEIIVDEQIYNAIVKKEQIIVSKEKIENPDIIIKTTKEEAIKIIQKKEYVKDSFTTEKSIIELKADKTKLFAKGYLNLYNKFSDSSITGNIIKIYSD